MSAPSSLLKSLSQIGRAASPRRLTAEPELEFTENADAKEIDHEDAHNEDGLANSQSTHIQSALAQQPLTIQIAICTLLVQ